MPLNQPTLSSSSSATSSEHWSSVLANTVMSSNEHDETLFHATAKQIHDSDRPWKDALDKLFENEDELHQLLRIAR